MIRYAFVLIKIFYRERSEGGDKFEAEPYPLPDRFEVRSTEASPHSPRSEGPWGRGLRAQARATKACAAAVFVLRGFVRE